MLREPADAGEPAALFVDVPLISTDAVELDPGAPDGFGREDGGGDARFHVARAAPVDAPVAHGPGNGIDRPSVAGGDDVVVAVEMNGGRDRAAAAKADDVDARVRARVLRAAFGGDVVDVEAARLRADRRSVARSPRSARPAD